MRGISQKFWLFVGTLLTVLLLAAGGIEAWLSNRDSVEAIASIQRSESRAAAARITEYLRTIEAQIGDLANLPWNSGALSETDRQEEFHRMMKLVPAIF